MSKKTALYAIRCLFLHPTRVESGDGNLYEERINVWKASSLDDAYMLARKEAEEYADGRDVVFIGTTDGFNIFDQEFKSGMEVWSIMRGSNLDADTYKATFLCTTKDRSFDFFEK